MTPDSSIRQADAKIIALLVVLLAGVVGLIAFALKDPPIDTSHLHPVRAAHATLPPQASRVGATAVKASAKTVAEETWAADESARGSRSDASH